MVLAFFFSRTSSVFKNRVGSSNSEITTVSFKSGPTMLDMPHLQHFFEAEEMPYQVTDGDVPGETPGSLNC